MKSTKHHIPDTIDFSELPIANLLHTESIFRTLSFKTARTAWLLAYHLSQLSQLSAEEQDQVAYQINTVIKDGLRQKRNPTK